MSDSLKLAFDRLIDMYESEGDSISLCIITAFRDYCVYGGRLSDLTWLNGLSLD